MILRAQDVPSSRSTHVLLLLNNCLNLASSNDVRWVRLGACPNMPTSRMVLEVEYSHVKGVKRPYPEILQV